MNEKIFLSVVIPAFNEAENFKKGCLSQVAQYLKNQRYSWEVILSDDGSTDETPRLLHRFAKENKGFLYLRIPHGGKFAAVRRGVMMAEGQYVLFTDFDQSTPLREFEKMLFEFKNGAKVVIASRYELGSETSGGSIFNHVKSKVWNRLTQFLMGEEFKDTSCGFKAFRALVLKKLLGQLLVHKPVEIKDQRPFMGCFDLELIFIAKKWGLKIVSIPVTYHFAKSDRFTIREPFVILWVIFKIWWNNLLGRYQLRKNETG